VSEAFSFMNTADFSMYFEANCPLIQIYFVYQLSLFFRVGSGTVGRLGQPEGSVGIHAGLGLECHHFARLALCCVCTGNFDLL
jgi:hypothetical protein